MKLASLALCMVIAVLLLSGCAGEEGTVVRPESEIPGYYALGQVVTGGVEMEGIKLSGIDAGQHGVETLISLSFSTTGVNTGAPINQTPAYTLIGMEGPARLKIIVSADSYAALDKKPEPAGLFMAMYSRESRDIADAYEIYFQFTGNIAFRVSEEKGAIILRALPANPSEKERYYAVLAMDEQTYRAAYAHSLEMVLCDDGERMLYITLPQETLDEADKIAASLNAHLDREGRDERAGVITQAGNLAPKFAEQITRAELERLGALRGLQYGGVTAAEPWAVDARFLCWLPGGESALCAQRVAVDTDGETEYYEQAWEFTKDGERSRFLDCDLAYIHRAAFSPDGRYLALLDRSEGNQQLYLYDTRYGELSFLSAEGMGDFTVDFSWSDDSKLFAMSGDDEMRLLVYDPSREGGEISRIRMVEEREGAYSSVYSAGGMVYFTDPEESSVIQVDPVSGEREVYAQANGCNISPNGKYMMLITQEEDEAEGEARSIISIKDMRTGEEKVIQTGFYRNGCWSLDGETLHYLMRNEDDEEYPSLLYTADAATGEVRQRGALASDSVYTGSRSNEIILVSYYEKEAGLWEPITYSLELEI